MSRFGGRVDGNTEGEVPKPRVVKAHKDYSLWRGGTDAAELSAEEPPSDVDPERFPDGRITEEDARLLNKADTAIGYVSMLCTDLGRSESLKQAPDQSKIGRWNSIQTEAWRDRGGLGHHDHEGLQGVVDRYKSLARRLESDEV